jgi:hypothetical protein
MLFVSCALLVLFHPKKYGRVTDCISQVKYYPRDEVAPTSIQTWTLIAKYFRKEDLNQQGRDRWNEVGL